MAFYEENITRYHPFALVSDFFRNFALAKQDVHQPKGLTNTFCFVRACALAKQDVHQPKGLTNTFCFVRASALEMNFIDNR